MYTSIRLAVVAVCAATTLASPVVSTTATAASGTTTPTCTAPQTPTGRPACTSGNNGRFSLQLGSCGGGGFDGRWLEPVTNSTADSASVYATASGPEYDYAYPPSFASGPWAWRGEFAGAVAGASVPGGGLQAVVFHSGSQLTCALAGDGVPFRCSADGQALAYWYVHAESGQLFAAAQEVAVAGYQKVAPYVFQNCSP